VRQLGNDRYFAMELFYNTTESGLNDQAGPPSADVARENAGGSSVPLSNILGSSHAPYFKHIPKPLFLTPYFLLFLPARYVPHVHVHTTRFRIFR
jgi:hypothetical protein